MDIKPSAFKHGFTQEDILHAYHNPVQVYFLDDFTYIGGTASGALLEIGVNPDGEIFHAMKARDKFIKPRRIR